MRLLCAGWLLLCNVALAETREIQGTRIELVEILPHAPETLAAIDLGESPPAGTTRVLTRAMILTAIAEAGFSATGLDVPQSVAIHRGQELWSKEELARRARPALERSLRPGAKLQEVGARMPLTVAGGCQVGQAHWNELPRRTGLVRATAMIEILDDGILVKQVAITATVSIDAQGARHDVRRGDGVTLMIRQKTAVISALAEALADGDVGDTLSFRVRRTGKLLKAVLETPNTARVLPAE